MDACDFYGYISYLQTFSIIVPLLFWAMNLRVLTRSQLVFGGYLSLLASINFMALFWAFGLHKPNHFFYNLTSLLDLVLGIVWFPILLKNRQISSISHWISGFLVAVWVYEVLFLKKFYSMNDLVSMLRDGYLTMFCVVGLVELFLGKDPDLEVSRQPHFLLLLGLVLVHSLGTFLNAIFKELINYDQLIACNLGSVIALIDVVAFGLYAACFWFQRRRAMAQNQPFF